MSTKVLDLYSGMGGLSIGFILALEAKTFALDIDNHAVNTYNKNLGKYGGKAIVQDVLTWQPEGKYDIVIGGSPCQPFSIANTKNRGKEHPLFPTFSRFFDIVLELKPTVFLLENVKGLISEVFRPLLMEQLRRVAPFYRVKWQVLNVAFYGVPQKRERLFVLGVSKDVGVEPSFPSPTHGKRERVRLDGTRLHKWVTVGEAIGDLLRITPATGVSEHVMTEKGGWDTEKSEWGSRVIPIDEPGYTITEKHRSGQLVQILDHEIRGYVNVEKQFEDAWNQRHPVIKPEDASPTIIGHIYKNVSRSELAIKDVVGYRRLTVRECLRLQSFPDWWCFPSNVSISDKYKLVGEAVPPILSYRLACHIGRLLGLKVNPPRKEDFNLPYFERAFPEGG